MMRVRSPGESFKLGELVWAECLPPTHSQAKMGPGASEGFQVTMLLGSSNRSSVYPGSSCLLQAQLRVPGVQ